MYRYPYAKKYCRDVYDIRQVNEQLLTDDSADGEILNIGSADDIDIQILAEAIRDEATAA